MKKIIVLALISVMSIACLYGCGKVKAKYDYGKYVTLCEYKGIEANNVIYEVTDEMVEEEIQMRMYDYTTYEDVTDRGVEVGDVVTVDYTSKIDGKESEDYSAEEDEISVGEGYFYPEAEEALKGMKVGETKSVTVTLTDEFVEDEDVGKKLQMDITVKGISVEDMPELNQEFVEENTDCKSVEEYRESVKKELDEQKKQEYAEVAGASILSFVVDNSTFDGYPQELYDEYETYFDANNENTAAMLGMDVEELMQQWGIDEETKKQEIVSNLNNELVIGAIAQKEGLSCTEKDIDKFAEDNYADYQYESAAEFLEDYSREDIHFELVYQKVMDFLVKNAKLVDISEEEYLKQQEAEEAQLYDDSEIDVDEDADEEE